MSVFTTIRDTVVAWLWLLRVEVRSRIGDRRRRSTGQRSLLVLAAQLPPAVSGGVFRPLSFLRYGDSLDWKIAALGFEHEGEVTEGGWALVESLPESVALHRIGVDPLSPAWDLFPHVDGGFLNALESFSVARRELKFRPDVILASGPPFHSFVAAYYLSRFFGARLVLDYRDEWTECPFNFVRLRNADGSWERRCLARADRILFTTRSQIDHALDVFGELDRDRCVLVPNGWDPDDLPTGTVSRERAKAGSVVTLAFVGNLADHTFPDTFFETFETVLSASCNDDAVRVRLVGRKSLKAIAAIDAFAHRDAIELVDQVPKTEVFDRMEESDGLLLISLPGLARYIPGKLYDYLSSTRPIIIYGHEGEASAIVAELGAGIFVPEGDADALAAAIDTIRHAPPERWETPERREWIRSHTREAAAHKLFSLLADLTRPPES